VNRQSSDSSDSVQFQKQSISLASRVLLVAFCPASVSRQRLLVGLLPRGVPQLSLLLVLSILFLVQAVFAARQQILDKSWEIPLAFFIFIVAGILGDSTSFAYPQHAFVLPVLHEAPCADNAIATTDRGTVLAS